MSATRRKGHLTCIVDRRCHLVSLNNTLSIINALLILEVRVRKTLWDAYIVCHQSPYFGVAHIHRQNTKNEAIFSWKAASFTNQPTNIISPPPPPLAVPGAVNPSPPPPVVGGKGGRGGGEGGVEVGDGDPVGLGRRGVGPAASPRAWKRKSHQYGNDWVLLVILLKIAFSLLRALERPATLILTVISGLRITRARHVYNRDAETGNWNFVLQLGTIRMRKMCQL